MRDDYRHPIREVVRTLWFLPTLFVFIALVAGHRISRIRVSDDSILAPILFKGDANAARELLTVIAGTMITLTGLVFVLTVVALQIASSQFSPRLLRTFLEDPGTRVVLAVFVATFAYSLGGLFEVGQGDSQGDEFLPQLAVTGSLVLALLSVGMLVFYIQHIANSIRIDSVMLAVRESTLASIIENYPPSAGLEAPTASPPEPPRDAEVIAVNRSGYLQEVDLDGVVELARSIKGTIVFRRQIGHHVVEGSPLALVWGDDGRLVDADQVSVDLNRTLALTGERRVESDPAFGVRQLIDVALRATAPSANDPYTAVQAVQHLSIIMARLSTRATEDKQIFDGNKLRVYLPVPRFALLLATVCMNLRRSAADRPRVMEELLRLLETCASISSWPERLSDIGRQVDLVLHDAALAITPAADFQSVKAVGELASAAAQPRM